MRVSDLQRKGLCDKRVAQHAARRLLLLLQAVTAVLYVDACSYDITALIVCLVAIRHHTHGPQKLTPGARYLTAVFRAKLSGVLVCICFAFVYFMCISIL